MNSTYGVNSRMPAGTRVNRGAHSALDAARAAAGGTGPEGQASLLARATNNNAARFTPANTGPRNGDPTFVRGEDGNQNIPADYRSAEDFPTVYHRHGNELENQIAAQQQVDSAHEGDDQYVHFEKPGEVELVMKGKQVAELANFDRYVNVMFDPRNPSSQKFLDEIYPEFKQRRVGQVFQDIEFAIRSQLIDMYGVASFEDLVFLYNRDQGAINGPRLSGANTPSSNGYVAGIGLSVLNRLQTSTEKGGPLKLPFSTAQVGSKPSAEAVADGGWQLNGQGYPLQYVETPKIFAQNLLGLGANGRPINEANERGQQLLDPQYQPRPQTRNAANALGITPQRYAGGANLTGGGYGNTG